MRLTYCSWVADGLLANDNVSQVVVVAKGIKERDALRSKLEGVFKTQFPDVVARAMPLEMGPPVGWPIKYRVTGPDPGVEHEHEGLDLHLRRTAKLRSRKAPPGGSASTRVFFRARRDGVNNAFFRRSGDRLARWQSTARCGRPSKGRRTE